MVNLCTVVPGGVVCFFPSYEIEKKVHSRWTETKLLDKISRKKKVSGDSVCVNIPWQFAKHFTWYHCLWFLSNVYSIFLGTFLPNSIMCSPYIKGHLLYLCGLWFCHIIECSIFLGTSLPNSIVCSPYIKKDTSYACAVCCSIACMYS